MCRYANESPRDHNRRLIHRILWVCFWDLKFAAENHGSIRRRDVRRALRAIGHMPRLERLLDKHRAEMPTAK